MAPCCFSPIMAVGDLECLIDAKLEVTFFEENETRLGFLTLKLIVIALV